MKQIRNMKQMGNYILMVGFLYGCGRPSANYEVDVFGAGSTIADVQTPPEKKSGIVELGRYRLYGADLGLGFTGMYADIPDSSGTQFVMGQGSFAYPPHESFDRMSMLVTTGPATSDTCMTVISSRTESGSVEYVDVGDTIVLKNDRISIGLPRDPNVYPRPAGESWYVAYGNELLPVLQNYAYRADTWSEEFQELQLSFAGALPPKDATVGAIPYPTTTTIQLPESLQDVQLNGVDLSADSTSFVGPWTENVVLNWKTAQTPSSLTLSIRALGKGISVGDCTCDEDCGDGMVCSQNSCFVERGATDAQLGEVVCTLDDDGHFELQKQHVEQLLQQTKSEAIGYLLVLSRIKTGDFTIPEILSHNGKKLATEPVRWRTMDSILTRLEGPQ